jgi:hypothetical protein
MIFSTLLEEVESHCPESQMIVTPMQHKELIDDVIPWLSLDSESLFGASKALLGERIFESSEIGFEHNSIMLNQEGNVDLPISIACMYIRTERKNRELSLNLNVSRGYRSRLKLHPPSADIELEIWDRSTKMIFEGIYKDYRAQICRLLEYGQIKFFTSYCSEIVGQTKSQNIAIKLDEYFSDTEVDNCFSLSIQCNSNTESCVTIRAFLVLSVLYVACSTAKAGKAWRPTFEKNILRFS